MTEYLNGVSLRWVDAPKEDLGYTKRRKRPYILFIIEAFKSEAVRAEAQALYTALEAEPDYGLKLNLILNAERSFRKLGCDIKTDIRRF